MEILRLTTPFYLNFPSIFRFKTKENRQQIVVSLLASISWCAGVLEKLMILLYQARKASWYEKQGENAAGKECKSRNYLDILFFLKENHVISILSLI